MADEDSSERGFTIVDRRGERDEEPEEEAAPTPERTASGASLPEADFPSFLLSLATSALFHLGLVADPETGERTEPNLELARHTIDTLALLEGKTQGNLTDEEAELLTNLLTELRMRFVEASK